MKRVVLSVMACLLVRMTAPVAAAAQTDFTGLQLKPGKLVRVTESGGTRVTGVLTRVTQESIEIEGRPFSPSTVTRIERRGDRLWNGLAIGAAAGLVMAALPNEACFDKSGVECALTGMETGALLGLLVDGLHRGYTTVYRSPGKALVRLAPQVDRRRKGVALSMRF